MYFTQGVAATEVEVDTLTGDHTVLRVDIHVHAYLVFLSCFPTDEDCMADGCWQIFKSSNRLWSNVSPYIWSRGVRSYPHTAFHQRGCFCTGSRMGNYRRITMASAQRCHIYARTRWIIIILVMEPRLNTVKAPISFLDFRTSPKCSMFLFFEMRSGPTLAVLRYVSCSAHSIGWWL